MRSHSLLVLLLLAAAPADDAALLPPADGLDPDPSFTVADSVQAQLTFVSDLALDPDGSLYLLDPRFPAVLHLEADGTLRRILGRSGSGPGEFSRPFQVGVTRDSLWVVDTGLLRVTFFPRDGRGQSTHPFGRALAATVKDARPRQLSGMLMAALPDGGFLMENAETADGTPGGDLARLLVIRTDRDFVVRDTLTVLPFTHSSMRFVYRDGATQMRQPFTDDPTIGYASDGSLTVRVERPAASRGGEARFTVQAWRDGREPLWTRQIRYRPARLTRAAVDSLAEALTAARPGVPRTPVTPDSIRRHLYRPAMLPPVERVVVGHDRSIWLQLHFADTPVGRAEWMLLSPNGYPLRRVTTDARFRPYEVERSSLWGVIMDPEDVPRVVRYRVPGGR